MVWVPMILPEQLLFVLLILIKTSSAFVTFPSVQILSESCGFEAFLHDHPSLSLRIPTMISATKVHQMTNSSKNEPSSRRRSPRLVELDAIPNKRDYPEIDLSLVDSEKANKKRRRNVSTKEAKKTELGPSDSGASISNNSKKGEVMIPMSMTLPRTLEESIRCQNPHVQFVLGIDEAGRGPLAGPVVVAAVQMTAGYYGTVEGVMDSKKITSELQREILYEKLIQSLRDNTGPNSSTGPGTSIPWTIAVMDAATIDEVNILQATLLGMQLVASAIIGQPIEYPIVEDSETTVLAEYSGCFVVVGRSEPVPQQPFPNDSEKLPTTGAGEVKTIDSSTTSRYYALIDGNRLPKNMPCPAAAVVKGDSREYCIAAASILAKVTRDRMMHRHDEWYPQYNFSQHKGYPTAAHIHAIRMHGPSPIHRLSFAPLKKKPTNTSRK